MDSLAVIGGTKSFVHPIQEKWQRPKEREKTLISTLIDHNDLSHTGTGINLEFEKAFAKYIGCQYSLSFSHGTAAIMAAYYASGVGPGDEVLTPAVGYIASYSGAMHLGARPIFCDIDPTTLLIDPEEVKKKINPRTKAINIIHLNGRVCDLGPILSLSERYGIPIIDDASHAHGAEWKGKKLGNFDHLTCFSLQGINPTGKPVSGGEGGVVCTNNQAYYQKMLAYCHLHRKNIEHELKDSPFELLDSEVLGLKWRSHPLAMALALISLESLDERIQKYTSNYEKTKACLQEFDFISFPTLSKETKMGGVYGGLKVIYHASRLGNIPLSGFLYCLMGEGTPLHKLGIGPLEYRHHLFSKGFDLWGQGRGPIGTSWQGLPEYQGNDPSDFPVAEKMKDCVFSLQHFIDVEDDYFVRLNQAFKKVQKDHRLLIK